MRNLRDIRTCGFSGYKADDRKTDGGAPGIFCIRFGTELRVAGEKKVGNNRICVIESDMILMKHGDFSFPLPGLSLTMRTLPIHISSYS